MKLLFAILFLLTITGCASFEANLSQAIPTRYGYERTLQRTIGMPEINLIRACGPPYQTYESSGHRFLVYQTQTIIQSPDSYTTTYSYNTAQTTKNTSFNYSKWCITTFETDGVMILGYTFKGNNCKATYP